MANLTTKHRKALPKSAFGLPGQRKYPMPDRGHAANAKARASQQAAKGALTHSAEAAIDAKANKILGKGGGDSRTGRITPVATDRGTFRFKANRRGE